MKRFVVLTLVLLFMLSGVVAVNAQSPIRVVIDGVNVIFADVVPLVDGNNRTLVPLRSIGEAMGLAVNWDSEQRKVVFSKSYTWEDSPLYQDSDGDGENDTYLGLESVSFTIDKNIAIHDMQWYDKGTIVKDSHPANGGFSEIIMDTAAIIKDSRTYAPVRYLADAFRYDVGWDGATSTVMLNKMYSLYELGIQAEQVASWEDSQGWMFTAEEESEIQSIKILSVSIDMKKSEYSVLTEDEQKAIYESGEEFGKYLSGFVVKNEIKENTYYDYKVKFVVTFNDGIQKTGIANIGFYFNGGQGGYI